MRTAISCRDLSKTYGGSVHALVRLNLEVSVGDCFGLLGPNGAGKTTTLEILAGLLAASAGEARIFGYEWGKHEKILRENLGICLQETRLADELTVAETIKLFASFHRRARSVADVMNDLALAEKADVLVKRLSGGQRQRLAVATALVSTPRILFLDEPTTGLDPQSRRQLWEVIENFQRRGGTVLLTTHNMEEAQRLCNRIAIIDHGHLIACGAPSELIARLGTSYIIEFAVSENGSRIREEFWRTISGVRLLRHEHCRITLGVEQPSTVIPDLLAKIQGEGCDLVHLLTREAGLEDFYLDLTGHNLRDD